MIVLVLLVFYVCQAASSSPLIRFLTSFAFAELLMEAFRAFLIFSDLSISSTAIDVATLYEG